MTMCEPTTNITIDKQAPGVLARDAQQPADQHGSRPDV
jgi:hypothetical protein